MNICSENHDKVCYEYDDCPVCIVQKELEKALLTIEDLESEIYDFEAELSESQDKTNL